MKVFEVFVIGVWRAVVHCRAWARVWSSPTPTAAAVQYKIVVPPMYGNTAAGSAHLVQHVPGEGQRIVLSPTLSRGRPMGDRGYRLPSIHHELLRTGTLYRHFHDSPVMKYP